jgi:hypothetical protein
MHWEVFAGGVACGVILTLAALVVIWVRIKGGYEW